MSVRDFSIWQVVYCVLAIRFLPPAAIVVRWHVEKHMVLKGCSLLQVYGCLHVGCVQVGRTESCAERTATSLAAAIATPAASILGAG